MRGPTFGTGGTHRSPASTRRTGGTWNGTVGGRNMRSVSRGSIGAGRCGLGGGMNLMSPRYRDAVHTEMRALIPQVLGWWRRLPAGKKDLFVGIKLGHESSVGVNGYYYPHGNDYADRPEKEDPRRELVVEQLPGRGMAPIGYAAVSTLGLAKSGALKEEHLAEVVRIHLRDLCSLAHALGVPRDRLFTHCGGWTKGEKLYASAVNEFSSPAGAFIRTA